MTVATPYPIKKSFTASLVVNSIRYLSRKDCLGIMILDCDDNTSGDKENEEDDDSFDFVVHFSSFIVALYNCTQT